MKLRRRLIAVLLTSTTVTTNLPLSTQLKASELVEEIIEIVPELDEIPDTEVPDIEVPGLEIQDIEIPDIEITEIEILEQEQEWILPELIVTLNPDSFYSQYGYYRVDKDIYTSFEQFIEEKISSGEIVIAQDGFDIFDGYTINVLNSDWGERNNAEYSFTISITSGNYVVESEPINLNIIFSKFEAIVGEDIASNKSLYNVSETVDLNDLIYSVVAKEGDGIDDDKQIKIMYDGKTTDGILNTMQNFATIDDFNYRFNVKLLSDYWGISDNYLFDIRNNDLSMEVELPLTFGRPTLIAHKMDVATIYLDQQNDFNTSQTNSQEAKILFSKILASKEDEQSKITLKYGENNKNTELITTQEFLNDDTYTVSIEPINIANGEYQFFISKTAPNEVITTSITANIVSTFELRLKISEAEATKAGVAVGIDGAEITNGVKFVDSTNMDNLDTAIATAKDSVANPLDQISVNEAVVALQSEIESFNRAIRYGTKGELLDKSVLRATIQQAYDAKADVIYDEANVALVPKGVKYVTPTEMNALTDKISAAESTRDNQNATSSAISTATTDLQTAIDAFRALIKVGTYVGIDISLLQDKIDEAYEAMEYNNGTDDLTIKVLPEGTTADQVEINTKFVTESEMKALTDAITLAEKERDNPDTDATVTAAISKLDTAISTFTSAIKTGAYIDISQLKAKILEASIVAESVVVADDASKVKQGEKWVTSSEMSALTNAISSAESVANDPLTTVSEIGTAISELESAINTFKSASEDTLGSFIDSSSLEAIISEAYLAKENILAIDGKSVSEIDYQIKFVSTAQMNKLNTAIDEAEAKNLTTNAAITEAIEELEAEIREFLDAIQQGTFKTDLDAVIKKAKAIMGEELVDVDTSEYSPEPIAVYANLFVYDVGVEPYEVYDHIQYVLESHYAELMAKIQDAQDVFDDNTKTVSEINTAIATLQDYIDTFIYEETNDGIIKYGTQSEFHIDKSELKEVIIAVEEAIKDIYILDDSNPDYPHESDEPYIEISSPGAQVPNSAKYLLLSEFNERFPSLSEAKKILLFSNSVLEIFLIAESLQSELDAFDINDLYEGTNHTDELQDLSDTVEMANALKNNWTTQYNSGSYDVNETENNDDNLIVDDYIVSSSLIKGTNFVTKTALNELTTAIDYAQAVLDDPTSNESIISALENLIGREEETKTDGDGNRVTIPAVPGAVSTFKTAIQFGTNVDNLVSKLEEANREKENVEVIPDGTEGEVASGTVYVTATEMSALQTAIDEAVEIIKANIDYSNAIDYTLTRTIDATTALEDAISTFKDAKASTGTSTNLDVSALITTLQEAQTTIETPTYNGTVLSENGYLVENKTKEQVPVGTYFVTLTEMNAFLVAISAAEDILAKVQNEDPTVDSAAIATAVSDLQTAINAFNSALEEGTLAENELQALIVVAERAKTQTADGNKIIVSISKNQISNEVNVVTVEAMQALNEAIAEARATLNEPFARTISNELTAVEKLQAAIDAFYALVTKGELNESALEEEIKNAHQAKAGLAVKQDSDTTFDVEKGIKFVTETEMDTFDSLIKQYEKILYNSKIGGIESSDWPTGVDETSDIVASLQIAINDFVSNIKTGEKDTETGSKVDLLAELNKISTVDNDGNDTVTPTDSDEAGYITSFLDTNIPTGYQVYKIDKQTNQVADTIEFVTTQEMDDLVTVYNLAQAVYDNSAATAAEVSEQITNLRNAYAVFERALKQGTVVIANLEAAQTKATDAVALTDLEPAGYEKINIVANDRTPETVDNQELFVVISEDEELDNAITTAVAMQKTLVTNLVTELNGATTVQDAVDAMETRLKAAYDPYFDSTTGPHDTDGTQDIKIGEAIIGNEYDPADPDATPAPEEGSLYAIIKLAYEAKKGIWAIADDDAIPGNVQKDQKFVPLSQMQALDDAIELATTKATTPENTLDPIDLAVAIFDLQTAIDTFNATPPMIGTNEDGLEGLIAKAKELYAIARVINSDVDLVEIGVLYVKTQTDLDTLKSAIIAAQELIGDMSGFVSRASTSNNDPTPTPILADLNAAIALVLTGTHTNAIDTLIDRINIATGRTPATGLSLDNIKDKTITDFSDTLHFIELPTDNETELDINVRYITTAEKELLETALDYTQDILDKNILADTTDLTDNEPTLNALKNAFAPFTTDTTEGGSSTSVKKGTADLGSDTDTASDNTLYGKIAKANDALTDENNNDIISANKSVLNLDNQYYFVTSQIMNGLYNAIQKAPTTDILGDPNDIAEYIVVIDTALNNFVPLQGQIDSQTLRTAIIKSTNLINGYLSPSDTQVDEIPLIPEFIVEPTGTTAAHVTADTKFVTQDEYDTFEQAIAEANAVIEAIKSDTGATHTQATVDAAANTLTAALADFYTDDSSTTDAIEEGTLTTSDLDAHIAIAEAAKDLLEDTAPDATKIYVLEDTRTTATVDDTVRFVLEKEEEELSNAILAAQELQTNPTNQADVDAVILRLKAAYDPFFDATDVDATSEKYDPDGKQEVKVGEAIVGDDAGDAGSLYTKWLEALAAKDGIIGIDATASEVEKGQKFVPAAQMKALTDAIEVVTDSNGVFDFENDYSLATSPYTTDTADAIKALDDAIKAFKDTPPLVGTNVNGLVEAIEEAKLLKEGLRIIESEDGSGNVTVADEADVEKGVRYTSSLAVSNLNAAIANAQAIINDTSGVNRTSVSPMPVLQALKDAINDFKFGTDAPDPIVNGILTGQKATDLQALMDEPYDADDLEIENDGEEDAGKTDYHFIISEVTDPSELDDGIKHVTNAEWELLESTRTHVHDILSENVYADTTDLLDFTPTLNALKKALDPFRNNTDDSGAQDIKVGTSVVGETTDASTEPSLYGTIKAAAEALKIDDNDPADTTTFNNDVIATTKSVENLDKQYAFVTPEMMNALTSAKSIADLKIAQTTKDILTDINDVAEQITALRDALDKFKPAFGKLDSAALRAEIEKATIMKNGDLSPDADGDTTNDSTDDFTIEPTGTTEADITAGKQFVTQDNFDIFERAIAEAEAVILAIKGDTGATHTQVTVDAAVTTLTNAITAFNNAIQTGAQNLGPLTTAIANAEEAAKRLIDSSIDPTIYVVDDTRTPATVDNTVKYVTESEEDELNNAITAAYALIPTTPSDAEIQAMISRLEAAYDPFFDADDADAGELYDPDGTQEIKVGEAIVGKSATDIGSLYTKWLEALAAKDGIIGTDATAAEVEKGQKFVETAQMTALTNAIKAVDANEDGTFDFVNDTALTDTALTDTADAIKALDDAIKAFKAVPPLVGTKVTGIVEAIEEAKLLKEGIRIINSSIDATQPADVSDVEIGVRYVSSTEMANFNAAIANAQAIINDTSGVNKMSADPMPVLQALKDAIELFSNVNGGADVDATTGIKTGTSTTANASGHDLAALLSIANAAQIVDKDNFNFAIADFLEINNANPSDLDAGVQYVTTAEKELLNTVKAYADGVLNSGKPADTTDLSDLTPTYTALIKAIDPFDETADYGTQPIKVGTAKVAPDTPDEAAANDGTLEGTIIDAEIALKIDDNLEPGDPDYPTGDYPELNEIFTNDVIATDKAVINLDKDRTFVTNAVMNTLTSVKSRAEAKASRVDADDPDDPTDVASSIKELKDALAQFKPAAGKIDSLNLNREILDAIAKQGWKDNFAPYGNVSIEIKPNGTSPSDVTDGTYFITQDDWDAFDNAIKSAQEVIKGIQSDEGGTYTQAHVNEVDAKLQALFDTFDLYDSSTATEGVIKEGTRSTSDLDNHIAIAEKAKERLTATDTDTDTTTTKIYAVEDTRTTATVDDTVRFVLEKEEAELENAIAAATELKANPTNQDDINAMITRLKAAYDSFFDSGETYTSGGTAINIEGSVDIKLGTAQISPTAPTTAGSGDGTLEGTLLSAKKAKEDIIATNVLAVEDVQKGQKFVPVDQMKKLEEIIVKIDIDDDGAVDFTNTDSNPTDIADAIKDLNDAIEVFKSTAPKQGTHTSSIQTKIDEAQQIIDDGLKVIDGEEADPGEVTPAEDPANVEKGTKYLSTAEMIDLKNAIAIAKAAVNTGDTDVTLEDNTTKSTVETSPNDSQVTADGTEISDDPLHALTALENALAKIQTGTKESTEFTALLDVAKEALTATQNETIFTPTTANFNTGIFGTSGPESDTLASFTLRTGVYFVEAENAAGADEIINSGSTLDPGGYFVTAAQLTTLQNAISYAEGNEPDDSIDTTGNNPIITALANALAPFKDDSTNANAGSAEVGPSTGADPDLTLHGKLKAATTAAEETYDVTYTAGGTPEKEHYIISDKLPIQLDALYKYVTVEMKNEIDSAILSAKELISNGASTTDPNDVAEALAALNTAINNFKPRDGEIDSSELRTLIDEATAIKNTGEFTDNSTTITFIVKPDDTVASDVKDGIYFVKESIFQTFLDAIKDAEDIINAIKNNDSTVTYTQDDIYTDAVNNDATDILQTAINTFTNAVTGTEAAGTTSVSDLEDAIATAETAIRNTLETATSRIYILDNDRTEETVDIEVYFVTRDERDRLDIALAAAKALLEEIDLDLRPSMISAREITTAEKVSKVTTELNAASEPFNIYGLNTCKRGTADIESVTGSTSDDGSLKGAIEAANLVQIDVMILPDEEADSDIPTVQMGKKYILQSQVDTLEEAIVKAESFNSNDITLPTDVADEIITLNKAIEKFKSQIAIGNFDNSAIMPLPIYKDLNESIVIDNILVHGTTVVGAGDTPPAVGYWIQSDEPDADAEATKPVSLTRATNLKTTFEEAIKTAEYHLYTAETEAELEQAKQALDEVYNKFVDQLRWGENSFSLNIDLNDNDSVSFPDKADIIIPDITWENTTADDSTDIEITVTIPAGTTKFPVTISPNATVNATNTTATGVTVIQNSDAALSQLLEIEVDRSSINNTFTIELTHDFGDYDKLYPIKRTITFKIVDAATHDHNAYNARLAYAEDVAAIQLVDTGTAPEDVLDGVKFVEADEAARNAMLELVALIETTPAPTADATSIGNLTTAIEKFFNTISYTDVKTGERESGGVTTDALKTAIAEAEQLINLTVGYDSRPSSFDANKYYSTNTERNAFGVAIVAANTVLNNNADGKDDLVRTITTRDATAVTNAINNLATAKAIFVKTLEWENASDPTTLYIESISGISPTGTDMDGYFTPTATALSSSDGNAFTSTITVPYRATEFDATINATNTSNTIDLTTTSPSATGDGSLTLNNRSVSSTSQTFTIKLDHTAIYHITRDVTLNMNITEAPPTNQYLQTVIDEAQTDLNAVVRMPNRTTDSQVDDGVKYVLADAYDALQNAKSNASYAQGLADSSTARKTYLIALEDAITAFNVSGVIKTGTKQAYEGLNTLITDANTNLSDTMISTDGTGNDVPPSKQWVLQSEHEAFGGAITTATNAMNAPDATVDSLTTAKNALNAAITTFNNAQEDGADTTTIKSELETKIAEANTAKNISSSADGTDISIFKQYVSSANMETFTDAIEAAEEAKIASDASVTSLTGAKANLEGAITAFEDQCNWGTNQTAEKLLTVDSSSPTAGNVTFTGNGIVLPNGIGDGDYTITFSAQDTANVSPNTVTVTVLSGAATIAPNSITITWSGSGTPDTTIANINLIVSIAPGTRASIGDAGLRAALNSSGVEFDENGETDVTNLEQLNGALYATNAEIENVEGLQYATNLTGIHLDNNNISDISVLSELPNLETLSINNNELEALDLTALGKVTELYAKNNNISHIEFMQARTISNRELGKLKVLDLSGNPALTDVSAIGNFADSLTDLNLSGNTGITTGIDSIGALTNLENLEVDAELLTNEHNKQEFVDALAELTMAQQNSSSSATIVIESNNISDDDKAQIQTNIDSALKEVLKDENIEKFPEIVKTIQGEVMPIIEQEQNIEEVIYYEDDYTIKMDPIKTSKGVNTLEIELAPKQPSGTPSILVRAKDIMSSIKNVVKTALSRNNAPKVIVDVNTQNAHDGIKVKLDPEVLEHLADEANSQLELETDFATLNINSKALNQILDDAKDDYITFSLSNEGTLTSEQADVIKNNDVLFTDAYTQSDSFLKFEDDITITVPYTLEKDETSAHVYYVDDNGRTQKLSSTYAAGKLTFTTDQFAEFMISPVK